MPHFLLLLLLACLGEAASLMRRGLKWGKCNDIFFNSSLPYSCTSHKVPLDWTEPQNGVIELQLIKVSAPQQPSKGSIQVNFGGPGLEMRDVLLSNAKRLLRSTGGIYDLVAFDPRGTGNTIPFNCSNNPLQLTELLSHLRLSNANNQSAGQNWAFGDAISSQCWHHGQGVGDLIGTAFSARDLMSVVDALEEDGKLRYWGFSYGTTLGATVSAMFPDRIDKVVLDGNQNIHEYYYGYGEIEPLTDSDTAFSNMWSKCIEAGASRCSLAATYNDSAVLERDVWNLIDELKENPLAIKSKERSFILNHGAFTTLLLNSLRTIYSWPPLATAVDLLIKKQTDSEEFSNIFSELLPSSKEDIVSGIFDLVRLLGIRGSDRFTRAKSRNELSATIAKQERLSRLGGPPAAALSLLLSQWKFDAKERYEGPWEDIKTSYPLLIVGNTLDAQTPLKCAHNTSAIFDDSVVLEVQIYGHTTLAGRSKCAESTIATYFVNGTLPAKGTVCPVDLQPYEKANRGAS
ncbi:hypothetical protein FSARC_12518 [Fusarium sarcochroum]|uniref:Peptidase S33 tripeptidyl aminopeptidase-like C-terminal domain-containing protein n=1 Tax=Fusarium sarcochroum TaxID=1208366 RepID=A0A8H4T813_9HYPO|nr:hypothetical protein FSARC_12518 [Fusarium sarcochroum]